jgi:hypothetical protein
MEVTMNPLQSRRGAALPMVILLITVMTIALAAAYTLNGTEIQVGDDYSEQVAALALAESGRHRFLTDRAGLGFTATPPAALEVDTIPYAGGQAIVTLTRIRPQVQQLPPLYVLTSRGMRTGVVRGNIPPAERTVAQYLYWDAMPIGILAGWTSLSGLNKNGGSGIISGVDLNPGTGGCPPALTTVAGVAVPDSPGMTGTTTAAMGSPPIKLLGDANATKGAVDIDWAGMLNGTADITYDIVIPGQAWPSFTDPNYWPTIKINGDYTLSSSGRGTLIVTGTLTQNNNSIWDGIVLVGNTVISNGNTSVRGATITGLNVLLGQTVPIQDIGNGTKTYQVNSCNATRALRSQAKLRVMPNTWMDNWASY